MPDLVTNRFLFSHHYLERLCQQADDRPEAAQLVAGLKGWASGWDDSSLSSLIGSQVGPTLVSLGFSYSEPSDGEDPDLLRLYTSYRQENQVGLCYVAHRQDGETDLDSTIKGRHYAAKIIHALKEEELSWGLLTDGECWRLYNADELARYETFLEIDLGQVLKGAGSATKEDAAYLLQTLFTESAFEPDEDGECALDRHLSASQEEASAIEEHLSNCIEDVLRDLCQGFVERDGQETYTSDERDEVFRNATVLLYRLLFILYAEARDLLPLEDALYQAVSLDGLVEQAAQYVKVTGLPDPDGSQLWRDLSGLCSWINSGDDDHHIPAYNGDLFDDSDKRYIHDYTITDKYLAPALFSLGAIDDDSESGYRRIDYRDLSVRHLGSIYEGLLEYKLFITQVERVRRADGKGGYAFPKLSKTRLKKGEEDQVIEVGEVYFADSAGERKATGTYYTPEYIVDYIVQQTVRRGLEERREAIEKQLPGWLEEVETAPPGELRRLQKVVDQKLLDFVEQEVLTFRVCDPAMGSGHFLVNAVHTITTFIVETLNLTPWENAEIDSDPVKWRRKVAKRCLYGVDLNALAVELAKLSLWLTTAAKGKPLSFLDHHLRQGNSLIGTRFDDLIGLLDERIEEEERRSAGQISMFDAYPEFRAPLKDATDLVRRISARVADAAEDVESQEADYERVRRELKPLRDLADLATARHFGIDVDGDQLRGIARYLLQDQYKLSEHHRTLLSQAHELARNRSFFHWDLEFPDAFIDAEGIESREGGFSTLVGNPPWGSKHSSLPVLVLEKLWETSTENVNVFAVFLRVSLSLLAHDQWLGLLIPKVFVKNTAYEPYRRQLALKETLATVGDWGKFPGVASETIALIVRRGVTQPSSETVTSHFFQDGRLGRENQVPLKSVTESEGFVISLDMNKAVWDLTKKLELQSVSLGQLTEIARGMEYGQRGTIILCENCHRYLEKPAKSYRQVEKTDCPHCGSSVTLASAPERRLVAQDPVEDFTEPVLSGSHIDRWRITGNLYIAPDLPGIDYKDESHSTPQLLVQRIADRFKVFVDSAGFRTLNTVYLVASKAHNDAFPYSLGYIASVLNSRLYSVYYEFKYNIGMSLTTQVTMSFLRSTPVHRVESTMPEDKRRKLVSTALVPYERFVRGRALGSRDIGGLVEVCLPRDLDRSDVIHEILAYLAQQMVAMHETRAELEDKTDLFRYARRDQPFARLDEVFVLQEDCRADVVVDLGSDHHDIDDLRLVSNRDGTWTLELQAKFRDPEEGWQDWIKEKGGYTIKRRWVSAYRLQMSEEKARFYRYALPRLQDFNNASSFPGGYTRSTLKKLHLTKVPMMPDVDLNELVRLDRELSETKRKIELTDDLIDQIIYKLYGLTEEEIAIVEEA